MAKRKIILLDTNVWLDHFIPNRAKGELVDKLLEKAVESDVELVYALRSLHDVYWNVMAKNKEWVRSSLGSLPENFAKALEGEETTVGIVAQSDDGGDDEEIEIRLAPMRIGRKIRGVVGSVIKV